MQHLAKLSDYVQLGQDLSPLTAWRDTIEQQLNQALEHGHSIRQIIAERSKQIDLALLFLWQNANLQHQSLALFAIGGYGRCEMFPYSDTDLLILSEQELTATQENNIKIFLSSLWDHGHFKPSISVHTLQTCLEQASADITIATSLIEARFITGNATLKQAPRRIVAQSWTEPNFFSAKMQEQQQRYQQHNDTESNLEPDIKNAPGGLRDIHQIGWIAKRHFRVKRLFDLLNLGFISEYELKLLEQAESFLWEIRHHLHLLCKRDENRLLFDYQREIAKKMGYIQHDTDAPNHAIEQFMKKYYRMAQNTSTLNELLLNYFNESVITPRLADYERNIIALDENFKIVDHQLAVTHHQVFSQNPSMIFQAFYLLSTRPDIQGMRSRTLRLLLIAGKKIDQSFRDNPKNQQLFMQIIRESKDLYDTLLDMKRYNILGRYIPAFGQIIGLMQYDLFHIYTVDAHTLLLIRNLNRFLQPTFSAQYPVVSLVFQRLKRKDILFLAVLFHDIAKGRGGDHSQLGAEDAIIFCRQHGLSERDTKMVAWLVQHHLLMSLTAQKKDISDPDVVQKFAEQVGDLEYLEYLYCLTTADINATNPTLWNNWKASLLRQLYTQARENILVGLDRPVDHHMLIEDTKSKALAALLVDFPQQDIEYLWQDLGDDYFLKESPDEIIWHTRAILKHGDTNTPLVLLREHLNAVQLFIYTRDTANLFATTVAILDRLNLDVQDARIITASTNFSLDTYIVQDRLDNIMLNPKRQQEVLHTIKQTLMDTQPYPEILQRRIPRQLRHFVVDNHVEIRLNRALQQNIVEIVTLDQPGILALIGQVFMQHDLDIHSAKIATLGERVEDIFYLTKSDGQPMNPEESKIFTEKMYAALDEMSQRVHPH